MQRPTTSGQSFRNKYYDPMQKIRVLIENLDTDLKQLCDKCAFPKIYNTNTQSINTTINSYYNNNSKTDSWDIIKKNMLAAKIDPPKGVQTRTLSNIYRTKVIDAYRNRRIFTVYGNYHTVRNALLARGWLEKLAPGRFPKLQDMDEGALLQLASRGNDYETVLISKIINHFPAFFIWQPKHSRDECTDVLPHRNRVRRSRELDFATKLGLIGCAEQERWICQDGICGMNYPRFYRMEGSFEERASFIEDFRQTQCRSLLRYICANEEHIDDLCDEFNGTIPASIVNFALSIVRPHVFENNEIDKYDADNRDILDEEWQIFTEAVKALVQRKQKFQTNQREVTDFVKLSTTYLNKLDMRYPDYKWDGYHNLWILKPGFQCRGIGIIIRSSLEDILQWVTVNTNRRYIVQKYVERPLLIYHTKFDIRQYMLLSISENLISIWLYKDCYLRFSSQQFSFDDLRESIHLTNNSVQKKYKPIQNRDIRLPKNNMWSLDQFKIYLKYENADMDVDETWNKIVFEGFKQNLIAVVLASLEETQLVENAFELYGCDFMLDEEYNPILIEINSTPDLSPSTEVTATICPNAMKDLIKVIIDLPRNSRAPVGQFEKVYDIGYKNKKDVSDPSTIYLAGAHMRLHKPLPKMLRTNRTIVQKTKKIINKNEMTTKNTKKRTKGGAKVIVKKPKTEDNGVVFAKPLKSFTKEKLALRYTLQK